MEKLDLSVEANSDHLNFLQFKTFCFRFLESERGFTFDHLSLMFQDEFSISEVSRKRLMRILNSYFSSIGQKMFDERNWFEMSKSGNEMRKLFLDGCEFHYYGTITNLS